MEKGTPSQYEAILLAGLCGKWWSLSIVSMHFTSTHCSAAGDTFWVASACHSYNKTFHCSCFPWKIKWMPGQVETTYTILFQSDLVSAAVTHLLQLFSMKSQMMPSQDQQIKWIFGQLYTSFFALLDNEAPWVDQKFSLQFFTCKQKPGKHWCQFYLSTTEVCYSMFLLCRKWNLVANSWLLASSYS